MTENHRGTETGRTDRRFSVSLCLCGFLTLFLDLRGGHRSAEQTFVWLQPCGRAWTHSHQLDDHFFILGTVVMVRAGGMLHKTSGLEWNRFGGVEDLTVAGEPGSFDHRGPPAWTPISICPARCARRDPPAMGLRQMPAIATSEWQRGTLLSSLRLL